MDLPQPDSMLVSDHGVSHQETGYVRVLAPHDLHVVDYIVNVGLEGLHMYSLPFTASMTNCTERNTFIYSHNHTAWIKGIDNTACTVAGQNST